jgi:hypothetical protein
MRLRGKVAQILDAMLKHDARGLLVGDTPRVTEVAIEKSLAKVGLFNTVTLLRGTRQNIIDERMGIVWLRMAWGVRQSGGDPLTVWETFKVYDGKIPAVEAFMKVLPVELRNGGWE